MVGAGPGVAAKSAGAATISAVPSATWVGTKAPLARACGSSIVLSDPKHKLI